MSPRLWTIMIGNLRLIHLTGDRWQRNQSKFNTVKAKVGVRWADVAFYGNGWCLPETVYDRNKLDETVAVVGAASWDRKSTSDVLVCPPKQPNWALKSPATNYICWMSTSGWSGYVPVVLVFGLRSGRINIRQHHFSRLLLTSCTEPFNRNEHKLRLTGIHFNTARSACSIRADLWFQSNAAGDWAYIRSVFGVGLDIADNGNYNYLALVDLLTLVDKWKRTRTSHHFAGYGNGKTIKLDASNDCVYPSMIDIQHEADQFSGSRINNKNFGHPKFEFASWIRTML